MKKYISFILILIFIAVSADDVLAQKKRRKKSRTNDRKEQTDAVPFKQKLVVEIGFGNPAFIGGGGTSSFNMALKPSLGYKFIPRVTAGVFVKADYLFVNINGTEFNLLDRGAGIYSRLKVVDAFYLKAEYAYTSYSYDRVTGVTARKGFSEPLFGLGYVSGIGKWTYGADFLFHASRDVRDYSGQVGEIWIKADYNF